MISSEDRDVIHKMSALKTEVLKVHDTLLVVCDRLKGIEEAQLKSRTETANVPSQKLNDVIPAKSDKDVNTFLDDAELSNAVFGKESIKQNYKTAL